MNGARPSSELASAACCLRILMPLSQLGNSASLFSFYRFAALSVSAYLSIGAGPALLALLCLPKHKEPERIQIPLLTSSSLADER